MAENLRAGDVALVKGSRGVRLERAVEIAKAAFGAEER
jgi:UDP-N-acetylmuramyl pentapeptide synthase